jgi:hypothetical protein
MLESGEFSQRRPVNVALQEAASSDSRDSPARRESSHCRLNSVNRAGKPSLTDFPAGRTRSTRRGLRLPPARISKEEKTILGEGYRCLAQMPCA